MNQFIPDQVQNLGYGSSEPLVNLGTISYVLFWVALKIILYVLVTIGNSKSKSKIVKNIKKFSITSTIL